MFVHVLFARHAAVSTDHFFNYENKCIVMRAAANVKVKVGSEKNRPNPQQVTQQWCKLLAQNCNWLVYTVIRHLVFLQVSIDAGNNRGLSCFLCHGNHYTANFHKHTTTLDAIVTMFIGFSGLPSLVAHCARSLRRTHKFQARKHECLPRARSACVVE